MATTTVTLQVAARDISPRGARPLGTLFAAVWKALVRASERQGSLRAAQEMRRVARGFEVSQPNLAADLHAAAARCEGLLDERR